MAKYEAGKVVAYLDSVIAATLARKIVWDTANPTTYVWNTKELEISKVVIQRRKSSLAPTMGSVTYLLEGFGLFNILDVSIDGNMDPMVNAKLRELYQTIESGMQDSGLDKLIAVLPK